MCKINVVGLGAGDLDQLPVKIYKMFKRTTNKIYVRTLDHPVVGQLLDEGIHVESFDVFYEQEEQFAHVYQKIVHFLLEQAKNREIIYAVPGHPMLAEQTVQHLLQQDEVSVEIIGGQSYLDDLFTALKIDPIEGFQFVDATSFERESLQYEHHLIFCQVYNSFVASRVKLALLEDLSYDYPVYIVEAAGSSQENIQEISLEELDRVMPQGNLISVYVPPVSKEQLNHTFKRLREVIQILRGPEGCAWDRKQTHQSLRPYLLEETYELIDAINAKDDEGIIEELGDVLLQVMLHSQIGEDSGYFTINDVIQSITNKMITRHPHVFDPQMKNSDQQTWEELKRKEKNIHGTSILDRVSDSSSSLTKAYELQTEAAKVGFDWEDVLPVWEKLVEEMNEVKNAIRKANKHDIEGEFGDVLFALVNVLRFYNIHPEIALQRTNQKFHYRFSYIEGKLQEQGRSIYNVSLQEMDVLWEEAKGKER